MNKCKTCKYWDTEDIHAKPDAGRCHLATTQYWKDGSDWLFWASDDIQAYDPFLITKPEFGCVCWEESNEA